jgi:misacylated tRNA(Ala) deacylase
MEMIFRDDAYATSCQAQVAASDPTGVRLDRTVFYPMGGGQPGDCGYLVLGDGTRLRVVDTRKSEDGTDILHVLEEGSPLPAPGTPVSAEVDWDRRHRLMRMHTCMHLLCSIIEGNVTGGQVGDGKGRLDFDLPNTSLDKEWIAGELNRLIEENHSVQATWISDEELAQNPELVRTMSVKPPAGSGRVRVLEILGVDRQPCGGTHVKATGEIGRVRIGKIENKGRQNRRVNILFDE